MKTELTYIYKRQARRTVINCLNPSNAGAVFLAANPDIDRDRFTVVNAIGYAVNLPTHSLLSIPNVKTV
jgi:hypothetical protein